MCSKGKRIIIDVEGVFFNITSIQGVSDLFSDVVFFFFGFFTWQALFYSQVKEIDEKMAGEITLNTRNLSPAHSLTLKCTGIYNY